MTENTVQVVEGSSGWHRHLPSELKTVMVGAGDGPEGSVQNVDGWNGKGRWSRVLGVGGGGHKCFRGVREDRQD